MSICSSSSGRITANMENKRYNGIRRRKWGKWVSEIRVPGTQERLWLGTYATPEAAAVAHDVAFYCLRRPTTLEKLNFPEMLPSYCVRHKDLSPRSVQKAAADAGMAVDAQSIGGNMLMKETDDYRRNNNVGAQTETNGGGFGWEGLGNDDIIDGGGIQGGYEDYIYREGQVFDISVEDYL